MSASADREQRARVAKALETALTKLADEVHALRAEQDHIDHEAIRRLADRIERLRLEVVNGFAAIERGDMAWWYSFENPEDPAYPKP